VKEESEQKMLPFITRSEWAVRVSAQPLKSVCLAYQEQDDEGQDDGGP